MGNEKTTVKPGIENTPEIAEVLPQLGSELTLNMLQRTMGLYRPYREVASNEGLAVSLDLPYGPHARHKLDVYTGERARNLPVMLYVHGGGFVRGDKSDVANIGRWFARQGLVVVAMNYRLAPESTFPMGTQDVASAIAWIKTEITRFGGNPEKVILVGNSAGSVLAGDYVFRDDLQVRDDGVAGAILISMPSYNLTDHELDPTRDLLYYGENGDRAAQSMINARGQRRIPVMLAWAENEPAFIMSQTEQLLETLTQRDGKRPPTAEARGHNHFSIVEHFGTPDETLTPEILRFVAAVIG